ncbi:cell division protein FtsK [Lentibacillus populi]|uniref:Cell division protein FtsK n=1 Tax=Lentibacillus populi TaxID=1827502 RepID=A0A9W5U0G1_9BACI|nr:FtsK/SpoIIIE domain-containing protein [Lentibacillus populi]GGB56964.1 cell division protein FtsK [Lentibacillus populi]
MEIITGAIIACGAMYVAEKYEPLETKKIKHTFRNINYKVGDYEPKLIRIRRKESWKEYIFNVPYGLIDDPKLQPILAKTLHKPVHVYFDGKLHIRVYKQKLSNKIDYNWHIADGWTVPIGQSQDKMIYHDFDKIPHMTVAGMTRQGKTVLLKLILAHLINNHPDDVQFNIIDLKGGLEFGWYDRLKQVKQVASNVNEAYALLSSVLKQIKSDMSRFKKGGYTNVLDTNISTRKFIIIDEAAELVPGSHLDKEEKKIYRYCQHAMSEIARIAGALGYRLIFCTQYPTADTLPRQIKQNADAKISFRLPTEVASRVALDEQGAERITNIGRAIYRTHEKHLVQVPFIKDTDIKNKLKEWIVDDANTKMDPTPRENIVTFG